MKREGHPNTVSVPVHAGQTIKKGTLHGLIRLSGLTRDEFEAFLER
jgi:predicted RNA binding protein YcfA (HicA-like mRNA interferase family)